MWTFFIILTHFFLINYIVINYSPLEQLYIIYISCWIKQNVLHIWLQLVSLTSSQEHTSSMLFVLRLRWRNWLVLILAHVTVSGLSAASIHMGQWWDHHASTRRNINTLLILYTGHLLWFTETKEYLLVALIPILYYSSDFQKHLLHPRHLIFLIRHWSLHSISLEVLSNQQRLYPCFPYRSFKTQDGS